MDAARVPSAPRARRRVKARASTPRQAAALGSPGFCCVIPAGPALNGELQRECLGRQRQLLKFRRLDHAPPQTAVFAAAAHAREILSDIITTFDCACAASWRARATRPAPSRAALSTPRPTRARRTICHPDTQRGTHRSGSENRPCWFGDECAPQQLADRNRAREISTLPTACSENTNGYVTVILPASMCATVASIGQSEGI